MVHAYVDSSVIIAIALGEPSAAAQAQRLRTFSAVYSSQLLEAELRSALKRENLTFDPMLIDGVVQVNPNRPLRNELTSVLGVGYVRGADCLHLAVALYLSADPTAFTFLTLDARQQAVAAALGFAT
jgi:predicted nucleic acid-binding protein